MRTWRKWLRVLTVSLLLALMPLTNVQAKEGTVYEHFEKNPQQEQQKTEAQPPPAKVSAAPYAAKFIGSFLLILVLLFLALRFLSKKTSHFASGGPRPIQMLGGQPLGKNRSLQMVKIGDVLYILGVGEDVQLIRMIPPGEEQTRLVDGLAVKQDDPIGKWGLQLKKTSKEKWEDLLAKTLQEAKVDSRQQDPPKKGGDGA